MKVSWPDPEPNSWPCDWPLHYILLNAGDNIDYQLFSIFIMLKGLSRNIFKVNCFILLLLFVPIWSLFHSLLMNFCFHLSFLSVPHSRSRGEWEPITWSLLLCNLLCRSFLIGSLGLRRESSKLGNKRCLTHAPRIKKNLVADTAFLQGLLVPICSYLLTAYENCSSWITCLEVVIVQFIISVQGSGPDIIWQDRQTDTTASTCVTVMLCAVLEANWKRKMTDIVMD